MTTRASPRSRGGSELSPDRARITEVTDPDTGATLAVRHPDLTGVAQGYRQRQTLANLLTGAWVRNPAYWQNSARVKPRRSELASWQHFRERLLAEGYALETHREPGDAPGDEVYRILELREGQPTCQPR